MNMTPLYQEKNQTHGAVAWNQRCKRKKYKRILTPPTNTVKVGNSDQKPEPIKIIDDAMINLSYEQRTTASKDILRKISHNKRFDVAKSLGSTLDKASRWSAVTEQ